MRLGLLITAHCNAACTHCSTSCGPQRREQLTREQILRLMDEAAALNSDQELDFSISGGEPFLDFPLLLEIVAHGTSLGASVSCQTNGAWASSEEKARDRLERLRAAGLGVLGLSVSRFHDAYIPRRRVERALRIARELGLVTVLKCALTRDGQSEELEAWARAAGADSLEVFSLHPYLRVGAELPDSVYEQGAALPQGVCPAAYFTVKEDGLAYTCCMPGGFNEFLALGRIDAVPLSVLQDRYRLGARQQVLRLFGPAYFAERLSDYGLAQRLRPRYSDVCDLCSHLTSDPAMAAAASVEADRYAVGQLQAVFEDLMQEAA